MRHRCREVGERQVEFPRQAVYGLLIGFGGQRIIATLEFAFIKEGETRNGVAVAGVNRIRRCAWVIGIERVIARIATGLAILPPELRSYRGPVACLPEKIGAKSRRIGPVVILLIQAGNLSACIPRIFCRIGSPASCIVNVTGVLSIIDQHAGSEIFADWQINRGIEARIVICGRTRPGKLHAGIAFIFSENWLLGDKTHRTRLGIGAKYSALRTA